MNSQAFAPTYCQHYDLLYGDKGYESECDLLEEVFRRHVINPVETILDLGCGTGGHAFCLARRGYQVTGADCSPEMVACAQEKVTSAGLDAGDVAPAFCVADVRSMDLGQQFDAVILMFSVLGYQLTNEDVSATLRTVRSHLKPEGLFVCDVWYGPAVLSIRPSQRVKVVPTGNGKLIRIASGALDVYHHLVEVRYQMWHMNKRRILSESEEVHRVRFFFPQELAFFLAQEHLGLLSLSSFESLELDASEDSWNVLLVGRAV